jgi:hypothetical protein
VHAGLEAIAHHGVVLLGGDRDAERIQAGEMRRQQGTVVGLVAAAKGGSDLLRARGVRIHDRHQFGVGAGGELLCVEPAHVANADDRATQLLRSCREFLHLSCQ